MHTFYKTLKSMPTLSTAPTLGIYIALRYIYYICNMQ